MALGTVAHISSMAPFWFIVLLGNIHPQLNMFFLGPPKVTERYLRLQDEEPPDTIWTVVKNEIGAVIVLCSFALAAYWDVVHIYEAVTLERVSAQRRISEAVDALSISPNFSTMLCLVALLGLYGAQHDESSGQRMLMGKEWSVMTWTGKKFEDGSLPLPVRCFYGLLAFACMILQLCVGGLFEPLDQEALKLVPSKVQRFVIRMSFYMYKVPFHLMMIFALVGMLCFFWVMAILIIVELILLILMVGLLPFTIKKRSCLGAPQEDIEDALAHYDKYRGAWGGYLLAPSLFAIVLPVMIPLSLRFVGGASYTTALYETWEDRHIATYFASLEGKFEHGVNMTVNMTERGLNVSEHDLNATATVAWQLWENLVTMMV